jgi:hypothetical protein
MLWRVVESAATEPEERAAAGIALAAATDPATHARLLAAARGTAHPTLRSILTALGNGAEADARELARLEATS